MYSKWDFSQTRGRQRNTFFWGTKGRDIWKDSPRRWKVNEYNISIWECYLILVLEPLSLDLVLFALDFVDRVPHISSYEWNV